MTIPILPGPWGFLASAGGAAGAYGQGMSQRHIFEQNQAQENMQLLATLVAKGLVDPAALASGPNQQLAQAGGLPGIQPGQVTVPKEQQLAKGFGAEAGMLTPGSPQAQMAFGVPTQAAADVQAGAGALGRQQVQARESMTQPQARLKEGIAAPGVAPLIETAQGAEAQQATVKAQTDTDLWKSIQERLPKDKDFRNIAQYAAVHGLGWLTSLNDMYARLGSERAAQNTAQIRLITTVHNAASQQYLQYKRDWDKGLSDEVTRLMGPLSPGAELEGPERIKKQNEIIAEYTKQHPLLTMDHFLKNATATYGADDESYNSAVRDVAGGIAAQTQDRMRQMQALYKQGVYTDAMLDADPELSAEEKTKIKSGDLLNTTTSVKTKTGVKPQK